MMRWKMMVMGLALTVAVAAGCKEQVFLHECDVAEYTKLGLPERAECTPALEPDYPSIAAPADVDTPERPARYLTLAEAVAIALEHGTTGITSTRLFGTANDDLTQANFRNVNGPGGVPGSDSIRVLALSPALWGADIENSLSKFDAFWKNSMTWTTTDQPNQGFGAFNNGQNASFVSQLIKPLPQGGDVAVNFTNTYSFLKNPLNGVGGATTINPSYTPSLTLSFDQPLLQGFGVDINELRQTHPGASGPLSKQSLFGTTANINNGQTEGILITRVRYDQSRAEFEKLVAFMLTNVETAYWNLYGSYMTLYSREQGMRLAHKVWEITKQQLDAGKVDITKYSPILGQYEQFRADRIAALGQVLERERTLRALIGLPVEDGCRLVPIDAPTLTPYQPCWEEAMHEALSLRPELVIAREDLKLSQLTVIRAKNDLLPDLRFISSYNINALGNELSGNDPLPPTLANPFGTSDNALRNLASNHFNNWTLGLALNVPIGYRSAYATLRQARLALTQSYWDLRNQEDKATRFLAQQYRQINESFREYQGRRSQRLAYSQQVKGELQNIEVGRKVADLTTLDALRQWTTALDTEYQAVVAYNNAMAGFEFGKGTILQHNSVVISEGALPACAQVRATEHEHQRSIALAKRERAAGTACPCGALGLPHLPDDKAPSVAALLPDKTPAKDKGEEVLPAPKPELSMLKPAEPAPVSSKPTEPEELESHAAPSPGVVLSPITDTNSSTPWKVSEEPKTMPPTLPPADLAPEVK